MNHLATNRGRTQHRTQHSERPNRELPVLFHLMDVSRMRPTAPPAPAPPTEPLAQATLTLAPPAELPPAALPMVETPAAELSPEPLPPEPVVVSQPPAAEAPAASPSASPTPAKFSLDRPIELCVTPGVPAADTAAEARPGDELPAQPSAKHGSQSAIEHPVSPRPSFETRRKFRMPLSEDWFAAHGKYIAVVFVLALIGTVYLARTNRRPAKDQAVTAQAAANTQSDKAAGVEVPTIVVNSGPAFSSTPSTPPKLVDTASATSDARAELHPPTSTELAAQGATENKSASADNLFVFPQAKKAEERVAARPESAQSIVNPTMTAPAASPSPGSAAASNFAPPTAPAMPPPQAPSLAPSYPTTSTPPVNYPTTSPPQHAYPTTAAPPLAEAPGPAMPPRVAPGQPAPHQPVYPTNYPATNTFQPPPANTGTSAWQPPAAQMPVAQAPAAPGTWTPNAQGAWSPSAPSGWSPPAPGGMPPQYQPQDNSARGFRNERTGSSLY